jgi:hypothetical protein
VPKNKYTALVKNGRSFYRMDISHEKRASDAMLDKTPYDSRGKLLKN